MCSIGANTCIFNNVAKDFIQKQICMKKKKNTKNYSQFFCKVIPFDRLWVFSLTQ
jgi:hypothetical protein